MKKNMQKLKPCPFCGNVPEIEDLREWSEDSGEFIGKGVVCRKCPGATSAVMCFDIPSHKATDEEAITAWNRRMS